MKLCRFQNAFLTSRVLTGVFYNAIASFQHTLDFSTFGALWKTLDGLAKVAEGTVLLLPLAFITIHVGIAGQLDQ